MKFSLFGFIFLFTVTNAFKNTGMMYFSSPLLTVPNTQETSQHYMKSEELRELMNPYMDQLPTVVFQLRKDLHDKVEKIFVKDSISNKKTLFPVNHNYSSFKTVSFNRIDDFTSNLGDMNILVESMSQDESSVDQFNELLVNLLQQKKCNVIVEFLPFVVTSKSLSDRSFSVEEMQADTEVLMEDLDEVFNKYVEEAAKEDLVASIYNNGDQHFNAVPVEGKSLFETYQFFSNGVLLATFVSLFLVYVTLQGLSWLSSLQISYRALERPTDVSKKAK